MTKTLQFEIRNRDPGKKEFTRQAAAISAKKRIHLCRMLFLWEYGNMKTTLEIPTPLFKRAKAYAALEGRKLKDVVASALSAYLTQSTRDSKNGLKRCPFPLVRGKSGSLMPEMNNETIAKLQEKDDLERYGRSLGR